jgi:hypothetical protein
MTGERMVAAAYQVGIRQRAIQTQKRSAASKKKPFRGTTTLLPHDCYLEPVRNLNQTDFAALCWLCI